MGRARRLSLSSPASAGLAAVLLLLASLPSVGQEIPLPSGAEVTRAVLEGRWAVLALKDGRIVVLDIKGETRREWPAPVVPVRALALDPGARLWGPSASTPSAEAPAVLISGPAEGGGTAIVAASIETGAPIARAHISGETDFLLAAPGARTAYLVVHRSPSASGEPQQRVVRSTLAAVDLEEREAPGIVALEGEVLGAAISPDGQRIFLAFEDRIRTFLTAPLRSSWVLRSPGSNHVCLPIGPGRALLAARNRQIAWFDPENLPGRDRSSGVFPTDDALGKLDLPFEPQSLTASADNAMAVALDGTGGQIALVDVERRRSLGARRISPAAEAGFHPDRPSIILFAASGASVSEIAYARPQTEAPERAATPPPAPAETASTPAAASPAQPPGGEPREGAAPAAPLAPGSPGEAGSAPTPGEQAAPPPEAVAPGPAPAEPAVPAPPAPPKEGAVAGEIRGKVSGEIALVEAIVFRGPNSILKEHARVAPGSDGLFSLPLPPPGRYRIVLAGAAGAQLNYSPAYYQITIGAEGLSGIDFHVAGTIPGSLKP